MPITVTIADDLAKKLQPYEAQFSQILELGIREWCARSDAGYAGVSDVLEALAALPTPEEVLALRPTARFRNGSMPCWKRVVTRDGRWTTSANGTGSSSWNTSCG